MDNSSGGSSDSSSSSGKVTLRIIGAFSYLLWSIVGIFVNVLLLIVFLRGHKQFKTMSFFIISWQLLFTNLLALFIQIVLIVPINIIGAQVYPQLIADIIAGMDSVAYYGFLIFAFILTLNRFLVFLFPKANQLLFSKTNIIWFISLIWILFFIVIVIWNLSSYKSYNTQGYYLEYIQREEFQNETFIKTISSFQGHLSNYLPPIILGMYAIIFIEIKFNISSCSKINKTVVTKSRKEINLLIQSGLLCLAIELENLVWYIPGWFDLRGNASTIAYIFLNWTMIFMTMIDAFVIFAFSTLAKQQLKQVLWRWNSTHSSIQIFHVRATTRIRHPSTVVTSIV